MEKIISIIIPTFNNPEYFNPCVQSIARTGILDSMGELIIVNNGDQDIEKYCGHVPGIKVIKSPTGNVGWEGGLKLGLEHSKAPFVVFQNDDTYIPPNQGLFYRTMLSSFCDDLVGAVSPATTIASGPQSIYHPNAPVIPMEVPYLIFFTVMVRRAALEKVGGIDMTLPGGDDFDMSIRLRNAGYKLVINPSSFCIHHGFKTGERVHGGYSTKGGWNSPEMTERTNFSLIRKHGFRNFIQTLQMLPRYEFTQLPDAEGEFIRRHVNGHKAIAEFGCGAQKTVPNSIGIDRVPNGEQIPHLNFNKTSIADLVGDVSDKIPLEDNTQDLVIARHILEHIIDLPKALEEWKRIIKPGGELIIAVPDERVQRGIPLNPEHVHAFTPESLKSILTLIGFEEVKSEKINNNTSFVGIYRKK